MPDFDNSRWSDSGFAQEYRAVASGRHARSEAGFGETERRFLVVLHNAISRKGIPLRLLLDSAPPGDRGGACVPFRG